METKIKENQQMCLERKINRLKNITINSIYLLYIISILNFYNPVIPHNNFLFNKIFNSEINLTIKGNGTQTILKKNNVKQMQVYLNNKIINFTDDYYITIYIDTAEINNIRIIWDNFDGYLADSFTDLKNITYVDLSKLNTHITSMSNTFSSCTSLKSVNFSNLETSKVTNMGHLFANCISLTSIDLSSFNT